MGSMGNRQGEINVIIPSINDIKYCIRAPFLVVIIILYAVFQTTQ